MHSCFDEVSMSALNTFFICKNKTISTYKTDSAHKQSKNNLCRLSGTLLSPQRKMQRVSGLKASIGQDKTDVATKTKDAWFSNSSECSCLTTKNILLSYIELELL